MEGGGRGGREGVVGTMGGTEGWRTCKEGGSKGGREGGRGLYIPLPPSFPHVRIGQNRNRNRAKKGND